MAKAKAKTVKGVKVPKKVAAVYSESEIKNLIDRAKATGKPIVLKKAGTKAVKQTKKGKAADEDKKAMPEGFKVAKSGNIYKETRSNRTDKY